MKYAHAVPAVFLERPNRFIAIVELNGNRETVHVKNTGRCRELLIPGVSVILVPGQTPGRKTAYDLISVYKENVGWINIDSQVPNTVVREWLASEDRIFPGKTLIRPETTYGNSRVDFYLECGSRRILMEVKGCTLEKSGLGFFPDAPTDRGTKHLHELSRAVRDGFEAFLAFVIAIPGVRQVFPNTETDPAFADALKAAREAGVHVLFLPCEVTPDSLSILSSEILMDV